jgi:hypothetical protein
MTRNPEDWDMQIIAQWKRTGTLPNPTEVADFLLRLVTSRDVYPGETEIPIERDLLEIIGMSLARNSEWARLANGRKRRTAKTERAKWQGEADAIRAKSATRLSNTRVAEIIASRHGGKIGTIRKKITKK